MSMYRNRILKTFSHKTLKIVESKFPTRMTYFNCVPVCLFIRVISETLERCFINPFSVL